METNEINTMEKVSSLNLTEETEYISKTTDIPYNTVLDIIKGIDVYYYLVGIQDELTFDDDECEMFLDGSLQRQKYDPDFVVDDEEMLAFISSHTDIPDEIIEKVMMEDLKYQCALPTPVVQCISDTWSKDTKITLLDGNQRLDAIMDFLKYQDTSPTSVTQRQSDGWSKETKAAFCTILLDSMFKNPHGEKLTPSNAYKYNIPTLGRKHIDYSDIEIRF